MALDNKRNEIQPESAAFLSSSKGKVISDPVLDQSPAVGSYNPQNSTILHGKITPRLDE